MGSVNRVCLLGNVGRDPEMKMTQSGQQVAHFSLATSDVWQKDGKREERTEWHRCTAFGKTAETIGKYITKGKSLYLEGKLQTRSWDKDGQKHYATEILVNNIVFVGSNRQADYVPEQREPTFANEPMPSSNDDDTPF